MIDGGWRFASIKISACQIDWFTGASGGLPLVFEASGNTSFGRPVICRYFKGCSSVCELERYKDESWRALDIYTVVRRHSTRYLLFRSLRFPFLLVDLLCLHVSCPSLRTSFLNNNDGEKKYRFSPQRGNR